MLPRVTMRCQVFGCTSEKPARLRKVNVLSVRRFTIYLCGPCERYARDLVDGDEERFKLIRYIEKLKRDATIEAKFINNDDYDDLMDSLEKQFTQEEKANE